MKKGKTIIVIIITVIICSGLFVLDLVLKGGWLDFDNDKESCNHPSESVEITGTYPTFDFNGEFLKYCTQCQTFIERETIPSLDPNILEYEFSNEGGYVVSGINLNYSTNYKYIGIPNYVNGYKVAGISEMAFYNNTSIKYLYIGQNVKIIDDQAFQGCSNLETIEFEDDSKLEIIGSGAFEGCEKLENLSLPSSIRELNNYAFSNCTSLKNVNMQGDTLSTNTIATYSVLNYWDRNSENYYFSPQISNGSSNNMQIRIDSEGKLKVEFYTSSEKYYDILYIYHNDSLLTEMSGEYDESGKRTLNIDVVSGDIIKFEYKKDSNSSIGNDKAYVRINSTSNTLSIGDYVFYNCYALTTIVIPSNVVYIGGSAFLNCSSKLKVFMDIYQVDASNFHYAWNSSTNVYWKEQWYFNSNGVPTAYNK